MKKEINVWSDSQENTNTLLNEVAKPIQNLKTGCSKEIEILKRTQARKKMKSKNSIIQLKNAEEILTSRRKNIRT